MTDVPPERLEFTRPFSLPLRRRFRGVTSREGWLLEGPAGWGEFSPFWDYDTYRCLPWLRAAYEAAFVGWPSPVRTLVPVNAIVPAVGPEDAAELVRQSGCSTAKVKVGEAGQSLADDVARVAAVRDALGREGRVRIDVNGGWEVDDAVRRIKALDIAARGLEYVEQPCASVEELALLRRKIDVPVAADESVRITDDPLRVVRAEAADIVVLKVAPLGGVSSCLLLAEQLGLPVVVSSALESSVGLAAGVALAAALPELPYACGLATGRLLAADVVSSTLVPVDGMLDLRPVVPDADALAAVVPSDELQRRMADRLGDALGAA
ncbi:O-succinylbenzoate synthase [Motilibacter rhizosphaerae]|uniref:o-succinylbenzoate synthase n=1 Tax=Motilibacter rhizosphaerae TaxID=598652 RepID=A0A4Q7NA31_9ACTN|nr:o-succinylbenzoate synthase [Motilibacter rhizosphaerae]RZS79035.1 O-succinylbenzoate synthase [Motilibacter rhizosphaerae]